MTEDTTMDGDLRSRVVALEQIGVASAQRFNVLEEWRRQTDLEHARRDERWIHMEGQLTKMDTKLEAISGSVAWVMRSVIGAIILAFVGFVVKGGLNIP